MMRKKIFFSLTLLVGVLVSFSKVSAQPFDPLAEACSEARDSSSVVCNESIRGQDAADNPVTSTAESVVNILSIAVGVISVIVIVVAGITMALSQGDSGKVKTSRDAIIYASVGLIVAALSRSIVIFIINRTNE